MSCTLTFLGHAGDQVDADVIALTHGHEDHVGDTVAIANRCDATVIANFEICNMLESEGVANIDPGNPGGCIETDFGSVSFTQAFHSSSYDGQYMGMPCGLVIEMGGITFYHCGDTGLFSDMKLIGEVYQPDVVAVPVGDRFTMGPELATRAAEMIGAPVAIPIHYKTFPVLRQTIEGFEPEGVDVRELAPGESTDIG